MVSCGLTGHRRCIVSNASHTFYIRVLNIFVYFLSLNFFPDILDICFTICYLFMYSYFLVGPIIISFKYLSLLIFLQDFFMIFNNFVHVYNLFYICTLTCIWVCSRNKRIRI